ncbi:MAG: hypothetical protein AAFY57_07215 [Cyanobacteria bacterium J06642_2]
MPVKRYETKQFIEPAPYVAFGAVGLVAIALVIAPLFSRNLLRERIQVPPGETVKLSAIQPRASWIGALQIDVRATVSPNSWAEFEVQVFDLNNNLLASAVKQAWQESGTWYEDGESGTWSESDLRGQLDIRRQDLTEPIEIAVSALEQGTTAGQTLSTPIQFDVSVWDGSIDRRFLWSGLLVGLLLSGFTWMTVRTSGQMILSKRIGDSDVGGRARLGGANTLVRVAIKVDSDETSPTSLRAELAIKDGRGNLVYEAQIPMPLKFHNDDDGRVDHATGQCHVDMVLEQEDSYGFYVEVVPDAPVDRTTLQVIQGVRTLGVTEVIGIQSRA